MAALAGALLATREASANGRFPRANQVVADPSDATRLVMRTTYGLAQSTDAGAHWYWTCEEAFGVSGIVDPMLGIASGGALFAATPSGLKVNRDPALCAWTDATPLFDGKNVSDLAVDPLDPSHVIAAASVYEPDAGGVDGGFAYFDLFAESHDGGATWSAVSGHPSTDFLVDTVDFAPKSGRIYASGIHVSNGMGVIARSDDDGASWQEFELPIPAGQSVYIGGVDPNDADRIFVRIGVDTAPDDTTLTPNDLYVSDDAGAHVRKIWTSTDRMYGFSLSPDGSQLAVGGRRDGVIVVPTAKIDDPTVWTKRFDAQVYCLRWERAGLYVCGTDLTGFTLGLSPDGVMPIRPLYMLQELARQDCPATSAVGTVCTDSLWNNVAALVGASTSDAGADATIDAAAGDAASGPDASDGGTAPAGSSKGCGCTTAGAPRSLTVAGLLSAVVIGASLARRRRGTGA
jgi:MYXO-CTERM domain-containing protein